MRSSSVRLASYRMKGTKLTLSLYAAKACESEKLFNHNSVPTYYAALDMQTFQNLQSEKPTMYQRSPHMYILDGTYSTVN